MSPKHCSLMESHHSGLLRADEEKRRNQRFICDHPIVIESLDAGLADRARMLNYSVEGLYFECDKLLTPGSMIYLGISNSPYSSEPDTYQCHRMKIRWYHDLYHARFSFGYGAQHLDPASVQCRRDDGLNELPENVRQLLADQEERRKHPRNRSDIRVLITEGRLYYRARIANRSKSGLFLETEAKLSPGRVINVVIPGKKVGREALVKAIVVHSNPAGLGVRMVRVLKN